MLVKARRRYAEEFKIEAVRLVREFAHPVAQVARDLGIPENVLYRWRTQQQQAEAHGTTGELLGQCLCREFLRHSCVCRISLPWQHHSPSGLVVLHLELELKVRLKNCICEKCALMYGRNTVGHSMEQTAHRNSASNRFRQHPRVRVSAPFACALSHRQSRRWLRKPGIDLGVVYDLSVCGARVSTQAEIRPGDEVTLSLRLPKQIKSADITVATVKWAKDQFFGLAFTELSPAARNRLQKYVAVVSTTIA